MKTRTTPIAILTLSITLVTLFGCSITKRLEKVQQKALKRGIVIPRDTLKITKTDTLVTTFTRNDTVFTELRIIDTVTLEPTIEVRTKRVDRWNTRYKFKEVKVENKAMIDSLKQVVRIERQKTKQTRAENRGFRWWWLLITFALGFILNNLIRLVQIFKLTK